MSEETRRLRATEIAAAATKIAKFQEVIDMCEACIEEIRNGVSAELPEDREWRLAQMSPGERKLAEISELMFQRSMLHAFEQENNLLGDLEFARGPQWKIGTELRIKLPPKDPR